MVIYSLMVSLTQLEPEELREHSGFLGFGGREFKIHKFDPDEIIVTHNLWYQGKVPDTHKELLQDNAEFVKG